MENRQDTEEPGLQGPSSSLNGVENSETDEKAGIPDSENNYGSGDFEDGDLIAKQDWAAQLEEEISKLYITDEIEKEKELKADRRVRIHKLLGLMQMSSMFYLTGGKVLMTKEQVDKRKIELKESVDDCIKMLEFLDATEPPTFIPQNLKNMKPIQKLRILSWDLGMLCYQYMGTRAEAIVDMILKEEFDIILLQELNPFVYYYLLYKLSDKYAVFRGRRKEDLNFFRDFTVTLVRLETVTVISNKKIVYFANTRERRTLLKTEVAVGSTKLCLLNTHLESMLHNSKVRMQQLRKCFDVCRSYSSDFNVILCGSFNIRDWEVRKLLTPKDSKILDLFETFGNKNTEFTWDLRKNILVQFPGYSDLTLLPPNKQPFTRYDRMYFRSSKESLIQPMSFNLIGKEIVAAGKYCASDHWALTADFSVSKDCYKNPIPINPGESEADQTVSSTRRNPDLLEGEDEESNKKKVEEDVKDNWDDSSDDE